MVKPVQEMGSWRRWRWRFVHGGAICVIRVHESLVLDGRRCCRVCAAATVAAGHLDLRWGAVSARVADALGARAAVDVIDHDHLGRLEDEALIVSPRGAADALAEAGRKGKDFEAVSNQAVALSVLNSWVFHCWRLD